MYQWCGFKSRRGKNKNLTALKSNSNTIWFNFQTYIYIYIYSGTCLIRHTKGPKKCVGLYRMSEYSGFITEILCSHRSTFLSDVTGCQKTQISDWTSSIVHTNIPCTFWKNFLKYPIKYIIYYHMNVHLCSWEIKSLTRSMSCARNESFCNHGHEGWAETLEVCSCVSFSNLSVDHGYQKKKLTLGK